MQVQKDEILLQFRCTGSGNCCRASGYVRVTAQDMTHMANKLGISVTEFRDTMVVRVNGWEMISTPTHRPLCFLDEANRCTVYNDRPLACRTYPNWPEIWESEDALKDEATRCPGLAAAMRQVDAQR
jgi:Fe-S-cluster containining protein